MTEEGQFAGLQQKDPNWAAAHSFTSCFPYIVREKALDTELKGLLQETFELETKEEYNLGEHDEVQRKFVQRQ